MMGRLYLPISRCRTGVSEATKAAINALPPSTWTYAATVEAMRPPVDGNAADECGDDDDDDSDGFDTWEE
jgi:hypothetical protein